MNHDEFVLRAETCRKKLMRIAASMIRSCDCEDAVQGAMASAWAHLDVLRDDRTFEAWLMRILVNRCRQIQREYKKEKDLLDAMKRDGWNADAGISALREAMGALNERERSLIRLHHEYGYTIKELAEGSGESEAVLKMRLYRARKRLKVLLLSLLLLVLLASVAIGTGMIDVAWFFLNRRAETVSMGNRVSAEIFDVRYSGEMLEVVATDAVWDYDELTLTIVYAVTGKTDDMVIYSGSIGVDGVRREHVWTQEGVVPINEQGVDGRIFEFSVGEWKLNGIALRDSADDVPEGLGVSLLSEIHFAAVDPDRYSLAIGESDSLELTSRIALKDSLTGATLEEGTVLLRLSAPNAKEWRKLHEAYYD